MITKTNKKKALKQYKQGNITAAFGNDLLTTGTTAIPNILLKMYKHMGLKDNEMLLLIQLLRLRIEDRKLDLVVEELADYLNDGTLEISGTLNGLIEKGVLGVANYYDENLGQIYEGYDFEPLFDKLSELWACFKVKELERAQQLLEEKTVRLKDSGISDPRVSKLFTAFEEEFGRPLSPIEIDQIRQWFEETELPLIMEALRRAVLRGKHNFRYIDHILLNWKKNNIRTIEEALEKDRYFNSPPKDEHIRDEDTKKRSIIKTLYLS